MNKQDLNKAFTTVFISAVVGFVLAVAIVALISCGRQTTNERAQPNAEQTAITQLQNQVMALQGTVTQINNFTSNEYDTCNNTGDGTSAFVQQVCKIAKSASADDLVQLKGELGNYVNNLTIEIQAAETSITAVQTQETTDVTAINAQIASINGQITTINSSLATLQTQMTNANTAITALQNTVNGITNTLNNTLTDIEIGTENVGAGPLYETVERRTDKTKIVAYVEAFGTPIALSNNSLTATNASNSIKITLTAHGLNVGSLINLAGLVGSKGITNADIAGYQVVASVVDANNFTILVKNNATGSGTFGGNTGTLSTVLGVGLGQIWTTANGADVAVRTTSYGTAYNFIVLVNGNLCYDKTVAAQTFAIINAQGVNVVCK